MTDEERRNEAPLEQEPGVGAGPGGGFLAGILIGAAIGAGIALLLAPESGSRMRDRLGRGARRFSRAARDQFDEATDVARRELRRRRRRLKQLTDRD